MGALLTLVFVALVQLSVVLHVRNTLIDCATEGARYGALADRDPSAGAQRTRELVTTDLSGAYAGDVVVAVERVDGLEMVVVRVRAPLPVIGLLGPGRVVRVSGRAVVEGS